MKAFLQQAGYELHHASGIWSKPSYGGIAYSDGDEIETRIADIVSQATDVTVLSTQLRQHCIDWPSLYHLSGSRANVLRPFGAMLKGDILEIGAGCGAITRYLGECGANVLALEGSTRRAGIARSRTRDLNNVVVIAETFDQLQIDHQFDVITLIGVLEYANLFVSGATPAVTMLQKIRRLLKPDGKLIIAIENQFGLKYFAGAPEDHLGQPMYGIEGRYAKDQPQTFARRVLTDMLESAEFAHFNFLAPFPDYKFPVSVITPAGFNNKDFDAAALAWQSAHSDPQLPKHPNFSLELAWPELFDNDLALDLSNSFLIMASQKPAELAEKNVLAYHYSTERIPRYCKETKFRLSSSNDIKVTCNRLQAYNNTEPEPKNELMLFNRPASVTYTRGIPLSVDLLNIVTRDGWNFREVADFLYNYISTLEKVSDYAFLSTSATPQTVLPGWCLDMVTQNIIVDREGLPHAIDTEWALHEPVELGHLLLRSLLSFLPFVSRFGKNSQNETLTRRDFITRSFDAIGFELTSEDISRYIALEALLQKQVTGRPEADFLDWAPEKPLPIHTLAQALTARDTQVRNLLVEHEAHFSTLRMISSERDVAVANLAAIRNSTSWRITAPVRLLGHISKRDFKRVRNILHETGRRTLQRLSSSPLRFLGRPYRWTASLLGLKPNSTANGPAIAAIIEQRCLLTRKPLVSDPLCPSLPNILPEIDISIVTFNSARWIDNFVDSLMKLDYPKEKLKVRFVDNSSTDSTFADLMATVLRLQDEGFFAEVMRRPNEGYGSGHNAAISVGSAPYCLVSNIDLTFEPDALYRIAAIAAHDEENIAAWELRQKPYEHPKYYDPVTGLTNWNAHACVLLRRSALEQVGGYDETLFMYGEDVELSYRLRRAGFLLRYCPQAVVWHYSYETAGQIKPLQYTGSTFANLYLRLKYGTAVDAFSVPLMGLRLLVAPEAYKGSRSAVFRNLLKLITLAPKALRGRRPSDVHFPFHIWDYELIREGAFVAQDMRLDDMPLVSIVTRTYRGRDAYLRQALLSVAHQTYPHIEHIIVEDGGATQRSVVAEITAFAQYPIRFIEQKKVGRSATGNAGLTASSGHWCLFLDDDDLLFADHIEVLVNALRETPDAVAAYTPAWEVLTEISGHHDGKYVEGGYDTPPALLQSFDREILLHHNYMAIQSVLFERRLFEERGGFDVDMDALEDWVLWKRYSKGTKFIYVPKVTSFFRTPSDPVVISQRQKAMDQAYPLALARAI